MSERPLQFSAKHGYWPECKRVDGHYQGEEIPTKEPLKCSPCINFEEKKKHSVFPTTEDIRRSNFTYKKFLMIEKVLLMLTILSFFLLLVNVEVEQLTSDEVIIFNILCIISFCTGVLILTNILRHICLFELEVFKGKIYIRDSNQHILITFIRKGNIAKIALETLLLLLHPNVLLEGMEFELFQAFDREYLVIQVNDILAVLLLVRSFVIFRSIISSADYSSPRAARICNQNGFEHDMLYSVKCLLNEEPLKTIAFTFIVSIALLGTGLKLSEGIFNKNSSSSSLFFKSYENCFWCVFITMTTVGYGDAFPKTLPGRIIILITATVGVTLTSQLIVSLSAYLTMQGSEEKSHITLRRLEEVNVKREYALEALTSLIEFRNKNEGSVEQSGQHKRPPSSNLNELMPLFKVLKKKIDLVKNSNRVIKSMVDTNNITEEMDRMFDILKDCLIQFLNKQIELRKNIDDSFIKSEKKNYNNLNRFAVILRQQDNYRFNQ